MKNLGSTLPPGGRMGNGDSLQAGDAKLVMQGDGNLVLYKGKKVLWSSNTMHRGHHALLQTDGDFVVFGSGDNSKPVWATKTHTPGAFLRLQGSDGNLVLVGKDGKPHWDALHAEGTAGKSSLFPDPLKFLKGVGRTAGDLVHGKVARAVKDAGHAVNQITGSQILQAAFPVLAPADILNGAVTGGKTGAMNAARAFLKNPVAKATYSGVGLVFPPLAPVSAAVVTGMEASSRVLDGIESKDPKAIASAALQIAVTSSLAADGIPGAKRGLELLDKTGKARGIAEDLLAGDPGAIEAAAALKKQAATGDKKAKEAHHLLSAVTLRQAAKTKPPSAPALFAAGKRESPSLTSQVHAALSSPHGLRIGDFSVLRTGRTLHKGRALPHKPQHKSKKAYDAYFHAHHNKHV